METDHTLETYTFRGQLRYKCPEDCGFDSYSVAEVAKHWKKTHMAEKQESAPGGSVLFDADEQPIQGKIRVPEALKAFL